MKKINRRNVLSLFALSALLMTSTSCSKDNILEQEELESVTVEDIDVLSLSAASSCGNKWARNIQANTPTSAAWKQRGDNNRCKNHEVKRKNANSRYSADRSNINQGTIDCRTKGKGGYTESGSYGFYNIFRGYKDKSVTTGTRIERAFKNYSRPSSGGKTVTFKGRVDVDKLVMPTNQYTYIAQVHGSGEVVSGGVREKQKHVTAIWLLRVQKRPGNKFNFVIESSTSPKTSSGGSTKRKTTFVKQGIIGREYDVEITMGYDSVGEPKGSVRVREKGTSSWRTEAVPSIGFATKQQYFRYGAYRVGTPTNTKTSNPSQARIGWTNENYCQ